MQIINGYRHNDALRRSFNALAEETFGLSFENWYQNGFWGDNYDPYSIVIDGEVVANASVNRMDMCIDGKEVKLLQLGTIMTQKDYRNRGLIREIMERIDTDYPAVDGVFLFANDSVLDLYPKFGFRKAKEFVYSKTVSQTGPSTVRKAVMDCPEQWDTLQKAMQENRFRSRCEMLHNPGLIFFYVSQFMKDCVFYSDELDAYIIAEQDGGELMIHNVFCARQIPLDAVIRCFGGEVGKAVLGFAPIDPVGFCKEELREEDTTFFVKGTFLDVFEQKQLRIPSLGHA